MDRVRKPLRGKLFLEKIDGVKDYRPNRNFYEGILITIKLRTNGNSNDEPGIRKQFLLFYNRLSVDRK